MEALQLGAVQMLAPSLAKFGPLGAREFEVFDLPYMFDNYDELHKVTQGPIGQALLRKLESKGILGLAYWDNGFKDMSANKPLRSPDDFKGLKMRIQSSKVLDAQMRALGAAFVWGMAHTQQVSPDLEMPMWIVYLAVPLGSYLMCFRFLQVCWKFFRTRELPHHDVAYVEGIDDIAAAPLAPAVAGATR